MSDHRITDVPTPGNSRHITTGVSPKVPGADWPSDSVPLSERPPAVWLCVRLAGTAAAAVVFVYACWLMSGTLDLQLRMLSGPFLLLRSEGIADQASAFPILAAWLPSIFAVGVRRNAATIMLSILALLCWVAFGFLLNAMCH